MHCTTAECDRPTTASAQVELRPAPIEPVDSVEAWRDLGAMQAGQPPVRKRWLERQRARIGMAVLVPLVALSAVSEPPLAADSWTGVALRILACLLFVAGAACRFWAMLYIGGRKGSVVVSQGPYSLVRNPLYWGTFLMALSLVAPLGNFTLIVGCLAIASIYACVTVPSEERRLASKHGDAYRDYCRRVPRFWPKLSSFSTSESIAVDVGCLAIEARRALVWMWIPVAGQLLATLRLQSWWPHLLWLP
jgi:protein-S-isoprenylcysteine O-methyltransferase Ste14